MNKQIHESQKITRQYEINYDEFLKFFQVSGEFKKISLMTSRSKKIQPGVYSTELNVKPWILIETEEILGDFES